MNDLPAEPIDLRDLRPPFRISTVLASVPFVKLEPLLLERFFALARPIANAATASPGDDLRLQDAGRFFCLVNTLEELGSKRIEELLLTLLDEFAQLDERSYNELYLWSIVHLSRLDPRHVETFWPLVINLDLLQRSTPWQRPRTGSLVDLPYRLSECVWYYYVLHTLKRDTSSNPVYPSLASCLLRTRKHLSADQNQLMEETLAELARQEPRAYFNDAFGVLTRRAPGKPGA